MESSWAIPSASMKAPRGPRGRSREELEDERDALELEIAKQKRDAARAADKIGALLHAQYYVTDWTFPFLRTSDNRSMSVSRFYPEAATAVDIFTHIGQDERKVIERKRRLFKEHWAVVNGKETRVQYGALDWSMPLADLLPQIEESYG